MENVENEKNKYFHYLENALISQMKDDYKKKILSFMPFLLEGRQQSENHFIAQCSSLDELQVKPRNYINLLSGITNSIPKIETIQEWVYQVFKDLPSVSNYKSVEKYKELSNLMNAVEDYYICIDNNSLPTHSKLLKKIILGCYLHQEILKMQPFCGGNDTIARIVLKQIIYPIVPVLKDIEEYRNVCLGNTESMIIYLLSQISKASISRETIVLK